MSRIFPFYNFMKINVGHNFRRAGRLDLTGMYAYEKLIKSLSFNQGIQYKDKSD